MCGGGEARGGRREMVHGKVERRGGEGPSRPRGGWRPRQLTVWRGAAVARACGRGGARGGRRRGEGWCSGKGQRRGKGEERKLEENG